MRVAPPEAPEIARPSLLRNLAHLFSSQAITWILATAVSVVLPRYLGPEGLGQIRLATAIWTITQLFIGLGTSTYVTLEMARNRDRGTRILGAVITLRLIAFASTSALLALLALIIGADSDTIVILVLLGAVSLIYMVADVVSAALSGLEQMSYPAIATAVSKLLYTVAVIGVLVFGGRVRAVAAAGLVGAITIFAICWMAFRKFGRVSFRNPLAEIPGIVRASLAFFVSGAVLTVYQQIDTVVISTLVDRKVLGWYSTADTLFGTLLFVPTILMTALFPRLSRLHVEDPSALDRLVRQSFSSLLLLGVPIGLGTFVIADNFTLLLYGSQFRESGPVLATYGVVIVLVFGTILLGGVATATGRQKFWNLLMIGAIVVSIALDVVLVPWTHDRYGNGAIGGVLAYVVTESVMLVIGIWKVAPTLVNRVSLARITKILLGGGVMVATTWPLRDRFLPLPIAVGFIVYAATVVLLRTLTDDEREWVRRGSGSFRRRSRA